MGNTALAFEEIRRICEQYGLKNVESVTFEEHYNNYLKNLEGKGSSRAFMDKVRLGKIIINDLGKNKLEELDIDLMSRYINSWSLRTYTTKNGKETFYSQGYLDKVYVNIKASLNLAVKKGLINFNVMNDIEKPISKKFMDEENKDLSDDEIKMIISAFDDRPLWKLSVMLLAYTGMRPGEIYGLKFSDFDYQEKVVKVRRTLSLSVQVDVESKKYISSSPHIKLLKNEVNGKKEYARRKIKVSSSVIEMVQELERLIHSDKTIYDNRKKQNTMDYLFASPTDGELKKPDYYSNVYRVHLKRKGINPSQYNPYRFRHTYCTRLFKVFYLDPKTVQKMMGDNSLDMVLNVYHSVNKDDMIQASNRYSEVMDSLLY